MNERNGAVDERKQSSGEQHATRVNGWCFCAECNEAREDIRRYDDGPDFDGDRDSDFGRED